MTMLRCLLLAVVSLAMVNTTLAEEKKRRLLVIGQSKGYQHDSISTAMATLYNLGKSSHQWDTFFRTDCTAITKKPLKWGAKNLDAFDAVAFFTDGDLDMDDSQKADLLSFIRDDGKKASSAFTVPPSRSSPGPNMARCSAATSTATLGANSRRR